MEETFYILIVGLSGLFGIIIGTLLTHYLNLRYVKEKIKYEKKLRILEELFSIIENNGRLFFEIGEMLVEDKDVNLEKLLNMIKQRRKSLYHNQTALYFNNANISTKSLEVMAAERKIIASIKDASKNKKELNMTLLNKMCTDLVSLGSDVEKELRRDL